MRYLCIALLGIQVVQAQDYNAFKKRLSDQESKYRDNVPCEKATKLAVHNLNELIWAKPNVDKVVKSCDFIRNQKNGCPQADLTSLLSEIKAAYKLTNGQSGDENGLVSAAEDDAPVSNMPDTLISPEEEAAVKPATPQRLPTIAATSSGVPYWIYSSLGLLALFCAWLAYKISQKTSPSTSTYSLQTDQQMKDELLEKLGNDDLVAVLKEIRHEIGMLRQKITFLEENIQVLQQQKVSEISQNTEVQAKILTKPRVESPIREEKQPPQEDSAPIINPVILPKVIDNFERRYALYMDNSEGFSVSGLMYGESAETIYEIILTSTHGAAYRICSHAEAQAYALSDPGYYLRTACDYDNSPTSGRHIETLNDGQLEQVGSIWKITKKARIRFV